MSTAKLRSNSWGYGLSSPALLLFLALLVMPLGLTVLLSFNAFDYTSVSRPASTPSAIT